MISLNPGCVARCLAAGLMALGWLAAMPSAQAAQAVRWSAGMTPALAFDTLDGRRFDSAGLMGKIVVANFWAVWCAPCREEMPLLAQLAASTQGQPVEYLLVNTGDSPGAMEKMRSRMPANLLSLRLAADAQDFRFSSLPATVVVDTRMRPRWLVRGAIDAQAEPLRSLIAELLAEASANANTNTNTRAGKPVPTVLLVGN
jgi:thiol-disulfide isomerase/thioredoxin